MNKTLRICYLKDSWSRPEGFISYLREMNCFSHMAGQQRANPYWWGAILDFNQLEKVLKELVENKSIKLERLKEFASYYEENDLSPIVRLTGISINRFVRSLQK